MDNPQLFLSLILDSMTEHIVVINEIGAIQYVNKSWSVFGSDNTCSIGTDWLGVNYINECDKASELGDEFGEKAGVGIKSVIHREVSNFYLEYPCHSPNEKRWFIMRVKPFVIDKTNYFVISHQNITKRKLAENEVRNLARIDGLTNIPNRRTFDEFLHEEWRRCARLKKNLCVALVDIDHFKLLNDNYGHQEGDMCLIKIGELLKALANRPGDICARYGGDEFALVFGDTSIEQAEELLNKLMKGIVALNIGNISSPTKKYITASIGVVGVLPSRESIEYQLISKVDSMLYLAKKKGRNRVEC